MSFGGRGPPRLAGKLKRSPDVAGKGWSIQRMGRKRRTEERVKEGEEGKGEKGRRSCVPIEVFKSRRLRSNGSSSRQVLRLSLNIRCSLTHLH